MPFLTGHPTHYPAGGATLRLRVNPWSPVSSVLKFFCLTRNMRDRQIVVTDSPPNARGKTFGKMIGPAPFKFSTLDARITSPL